MDKQTKLILGYVGVGVATALVAGAAVWALTSPRLEEAQNQGQAAEERVTSLESKVDSLSAALAEAQTDSQPVADASTDDAAADGETATDSTTKPTSDRQFCFIRSGKWETATPYLTVDYAEMLSGAAAVAAAAAHGSESPPPNDYYIVNDNAKLRSLPADPKMNVKVTSSGGGVDPNTMGFGQWYDVLVGMSGDNFVKDRPYWITIKNGTITAIEEQYLP
ncbi:MAG: hypothetical protein KJ747_09000 [Actinobacteria bacterium]|nr:hypothetical protein [Actinomycetota bacterium]MCG2807572.1 hypothetical protein [Coriobacteriia bacterium]